MKPKLTPMMQQYRAIKAQNPDAILFFRMGDFYEMFGEDACIAAPILEIALTSRSKNMKEKMPMCGIPYHAADTYIARLINKNMKVAICEQVEDPRKAKGIVKREVVRVITPGTVLEPHYLDARANNFLASLAASGKTTGLALIDLSTGEFLVTEFRNDPDRQLLMDELRRWNPREIVCPDSWPDNQLDASLLVNRNEDWIYTRDYARDRIIDQFQVQSLDGFGMEDMNAGIMASGAALHYLESTHVDNLAHITRIRTFFSSDYVHIDPATRRNLELDRTLMGGRREGSLLHFIDETVTPMGGRLLKKRLEQPLRNKDLINRRLDRIAAFCSDYSLRESIRENLNEIADMERLISRVATGLAHGRDLVALRASLTKLPDIRRLLLQSAVPVLAEMAEDIDALQDIRDLLARAIRDNPPLTIKEGNIIKEGFDAALDEIRYAAREGKNWIARLQVRERERTGISSLKVGFNKVFGYYIEVTKTHLEKIPEDYIRRQTMVNAERFITPELKEMEDKILGAEEKMAAMEFRIFVEIRQQVARHVQRIQSTAQAIARIDIASALAELAVSYRYHRPDISADPCIRIREGRHPVVERITAKESFVPNDVELDSEHQHLLIITGPNMAGKSTFIRQTALIVLLAHIGCFVPAESAHIGIVDRIFTRVGASDNLAAGQSTFMVEMSEAANILNHATEKSLVILDEIGRGTSTFDGLSIAWAVAEYLQKIKALTLFATHYHELTELEQRLSGVRNFNVQVREWNDQVIFLRKVVPGGVDRSYGIQVARLAGVPDSILQRAKEVLTSLEMRETGRVPDAGGNFKAPQAVQLELFGVQSSPVIEELTTIDVNRLTPIEALNLVHKWKKTIV